MRARRWTGWQPLQLLGADVTGATLGIVGFGRIGRAMAQRAQAFNMRVIYWNRTRLAAQEEHRLKAEYAPLDDLLRQADFISLHVAYGPETHYLLGENQFALMKPSACLINTARGAVVDEAALVRVLRQRRIAGAGLDVVEDEPLKTAEETTTPNLIVTCHGPAAQADQRRVVAAGIGGDS